MSVNPVDISATLTPTEERYGRQVRAAEERYLSTQITVINAFLGSENAHAALDRGEVVNYKLREGAAFAQSMLVALYPGTGLYTRRVSSPGRDVLQFSRRPMSAEC